MESKVILTSLFFLFPLVLLPIFFLFGRKNYKGQLPPGSLGLPLIGQSLSLLKALKSDRVDKWFDERITKHGPIWKTSIFGYPTVALHGLAANKFVYTCDGNLLANVQPPSWSRIMGSKSISELSGSDHKRVRSALVSFLRLEVLKQHVERVDEEIQHHLQMYWHGKDEVKVQPLMKIITFNIICSLVFGIERGPKREKLLPLFINMIEGVLSVPINLPFTPFNRGIVSRKTLEPMLKQLIREKKEAIAKTDQQTGSSNRDLITYLLSMPDDGRSTRLSEEEIIDNIIVVMAAGYETTSMLLTFLVKLLANNKSIYYNVLQEHQTITNNKAYSKPLTWEDLTEMKYTWRVATEVMRVNPPATMGFRRAKQDVEYGGFIIPKGWQVMLYASMTHMDDSIFKNPDLFDPTRFEKTALVQPFSYVAFGGGPRMCPGIELAKMETLVMMHHLVMNFSWEQLKKDESFKRIPMPEFDHGLLVQIKPLKETMASDEAA